MNELKVGDRVWIKCEVKPGPFSNERLTRIQTVQGEDWIGFVDERNLKNAVQTGATRVLGRILTLEGNEIVVLVQGHAIDRRQARTSRSAAEKVAPRVPLTA